MDEEREETSIRDQEYIESLERRVEVLTEALLQVKLIDENECWKVARDALNKSDDIDAVFRWAMSSF